MGSSDREYLFRSCPRYWLGLFLPVTLLLLIVPVSLFITLKVQYLFIPAILLAGAGWLLYAEFRRAVSARVEVTADKIRVIMGKDRFELRWTDIRAMQFQRYGLRRGITFLMEDGSEQIHGCYFDLARLLPVIQSRLPLEVQDPLTYRTLPAYQDWQNQLSRKYANSDAAYHLDLGWMQRLVGVGLLGFSLIQWLQIIRNEAEVSGWLILLTLVGVWLLVESYQFLVVSREEIHLTRLNRQYTIRWADLQRIYHQPEVHSYALQDRFNRIMLPASIFWFGKDKKQAVELVKYKIHGSGMVPRESFWAVFWSTRTIAKGRRKLSRTTG